MNIRNFLIIISLITHSTATAAHEQSGAHALTTLREHVHHLPALFSTTAGQTRAHIAALEEPLSRLTMLLKKGCHSKMTTQMLHNFFSLLSEVSEPDLADMKRYQVKVIRAKIDAFSQDITCASRQGLPADVAHDMLTITTSLRQFFMPHLYQSAAWYQELFTDVKEFARRNPSSTALTAGLAGAVIIMALHAKKT